MESPSKIHEPPKQRIPEMGQGLFLIFFVFFGEEGNFVVFGVWKDFCEDFFLRFLANC